MTQQRCCLQLKSEHTSTNCSLSHLTATQMPQTTYVVETLRQQSQASQTGVTSSAPRTCCCCRHNRRCRLRGLQQRAPPSRSRLPLLTPQAVQTLMLIPWSWNSGEHVLSCMKLRSATVSTVLTRLCRLVLHTCRSAVVIHHGSHALRLQLQLQLDLLLTISCACASVHQHAS